MDIVFKAKPTELTALKLLDKMAPEIKSGKQRGFFWAAHKAAESISNGNTIDWIEVAKVRLEEYSDSKSDGETSSVVVTHLNIEEADFDIVTKSIESQYNLTRRVQKSYLVRSLIKYGLKNAEQNQKPCLSLSESGKADNMSLEQKVDNLLTEIIAIKEKLDDIRKMLNTDYKEEKHDTQ
ncbi:MAG: hypothetical protein J6A19_11715 [Oscillospiraceae bacterium]|nr:hypothetical protein [Oscillospiraceae bacterium]